MIGAVHGPEMRQFRDPDTGVEITQYTTTGRTNRTLYFTNRPFIGDTGLVLFLSDRTGRNEMFALDPRAGRIIQLSALAGQPNLSAVAHPTLPEVYFHDGTTIHKTNVATLKCEPLYRAPAGMRWGILNLNHPDYLALECIEQRSRLERFDAPAGQFVPANASMETWHRRPNSVLYRMNLRTGAAEAVWGEHKQLTHVQLSPTNPDLMIYSSWRGYGDHRCYLLNCRQSGHQPPVGLFPESATARGGHECFTRRGNVALQWMEGDLREGQSNPLYHAVADLSRLPDAPGSAGAAPVRKYLLPERNDCLWHHFALSQDETWGVHDRWIAAPDKTASNSWLSLFRHQDDQPQTIVRRLCRHDAVTGDWLNIGADGAFEDNDRFFWYTSFLGGQANICRVDVAPVLDQVRNASDNESV